MGELILVLLGVAAICGGGPLLLFAYHQGKIELPKWLFRLMLFLGVVIIAILRYPLNLKQDSVKNILSLVVYILIGRVLRKEYDKSKWKTCFVSVLTANAVGIFIQFLIVTKAMVHGDNHFTLSRIIFFLVVVQCIVFFSYMLTSEDTNRGYCRR